MFVALSENLEYFKSKVNVAIMLAPVARIDRMTCKTLHRFKDSDTLHSIVEAGGKEMFKTPGVEGMLSSSFYKMTGMHNLGVSMFTDEDTSLVSK